MINRSSSAHGARASVLDVAVAAARAGGRVAMEGYGKADDYQLKGEKNLVTEFDRRAEAAIVDAVLRTFPDHRIVAEEGAVGGDDPRRRWMIDPIDGTTNYAHGFPFFAVSVAFEEDGQLTVGVILDPFRDELFVAERGRGATLDGKPIHVSTVDALGRSLLLTSFPYRPDRVPRALAEIERFTYSAQSVRRTGSAALELACVASGRADANWSAMLSSWDCAAGVLLVAEAGGKVTDFRGEAFSVDVGECVASNGLIHDSVIRTLREVADGE